MFPPKWKSFSFWRLLKSLSPGLSSWPENGRPRPRPIDWKICWKLGDGSIYFDTLNIMSYEFTNQDSRISKLYKRMRIARGAMYGTAGGVVAAAACISVCGGVVWGTVIAGAAVASAVGGALAGNPGQNAAIGHQQGINRALFNTFLLILIPFWLQDVVFNVESLILYVKFC